MKAGVRNQFGGEIVDIKLGSVMAQVTVRHGEGHIVSVMTRDSVEEAGLKIGDNVKALFKAIHVVLVKE